MKISQTLSSSKRGLTLLETMLALIMLSLLIVGVLGVLGSLLVASTKSTDSTAGTFVGQYLLEKASSIGPPTPAGGELEGVEQLLSHEDDKAVNFRYKMKWSLLAEGASYFAGSTKTKAQFAPELYHVEVTVWWMVENADDGRAEGGGRRSVTLERLVSFTPVNFE